LNRVVALPHASPYGFVRFESQLILSPRPIACPRLARPPRRPPLPAFRRLPLEQSTVAPSPTMPRTTASLPGAGSSRHRLASTWRPGCHVACGRQLQCQANQPTGEAPSLSPPRTCRSLLAPPLQLQLPIRHSACPLSCSDSPCRESVELYCYRTD
jgi:hypothetical protein